MISEVCDTKRHYDRIRRSHDRAVMMLHTHRPDLRDVVGRLFDGFYSSEMRCRVTKSHRGDPSTDEGVFVENRVSVVSFIYGSVWVRLKEGRYLEIPFLI